MSQPPNNPVDPGFNLDELPDWARKVVQSEKPLASPSSPEVTKFAHGASWSTLVSAATVSSFLPRDLVAEMNLDEANRRDAERSVLSLAEEVHEPDGTKWALTQDARRSVLSAASAQEIANALSVTESHFTDPVSVALREQLSATPVSVESTALPMLEAQRLAATWLRGVDRVAPRNLDDLGREITLRRLLKPFRRMVGAPDSEGAQLDPAKMRFFGRASEIAQLQDYVGVVPASGVFGTVTRLALRVGQRVLGARPLFIWGIGGVGKTTLISKFVLEHAEAARSRYPFAYLDFDRATLSARRPELLLAEMCGQVGAQFAELTEPMRALQDKARVLSRALDAASEKVAAPTSTTLEELKTYLSDKSRDIDTFVQLMPLLTDFRKAVDDHIAGLESTFELKRPFLLVFDTFELVQYSDADVRRIEDFIRVLSKSKEGLGWPRLRLIVSGRKKPEKFLDKAPSEKEVIGLGVLDRHGCIEMLQALASDAGQHIGAEDAEQLIDAMIAGLQTGKAAGLHPLSLKLLGTVLTTAKDTAGKSIVSQLVQELKDQPQADTPLRKALIDGILVRRILEHVSDTRVRALADPGLVVRRITPAVIREVMAMGTPSPAPDSSEEVIAGDSVDFKPWRLSAEKRVSPEKPDDPPLDEAEQIFEAFKHEVSLVEMDDVGLRHRQDLRQEMLPLIKARRPKRFEKLHGLAFEYFRKYQDDASRAEAVYHGLWLGAPIEEVDRVWPQNPGFDPRLDPEEFEAMPLAHRYIRAKTRQPMSSEDIASLRGPIATEWLISRQDTFLDDDFPNAVVRVAQAAAGDDYAGLDNHVPTAAVVARLLYRTGQWADSQHLIARHLVDSGYIDSVMKFGFLPNTPSSPSEHLDYDDRLSMLRTWSTMSAKLGADPVPLEAARAIGELESTSRDPVIQTELLSFALLGHRMLKERSGWSDEVRARVARQLVSATRIVPRNLWRRNGRALRFAILAAEEGVPDLLEACLDLGGIVPREEEAQPFMLQLLANAYRDSNDKKRAREIEARRDEPSHAQNADFLQSMWGDSGNLLAKSLRTQPSQQLLLRKGLAFDHYDWIRPLGNALSRAFEGERGSALRDALIGQKFLADLGNRPSTLDGLSICQWANAGGRLLQLAATIDEFSDEFSSEANDESESYPETAFGIAEALLLWHDVNLAAIKDAEAPEDDPDEKPARKPRKRPVAKKRAIKTMRKKK